MWTTCSSIGSMLWEVWGGPLAESSGLYEPRDRTYGRWGVPFSAMEKRLYEKDDVEISFHRVMLANGKDWVWYQVWQDPIAVVQTGRNADMIFVHGTGVHSGTLASQCRRYLDAGFRLIVPDLPSHGFSSGLHVYQRNMAGFCEGLHAVLHDVAQRDQAASCFPTVRPTKLERRKTFMLGLSFGGLVAFSYALQYPASYRYDETDPDEIPIDGLVGVGPMVAYNAKFVVVNTALRWLFLVLLFVFGLGRLEAIVPHKKVVDKDPKVYESLVMQDPRSHKGSFRIGHLWCIVKAMEDLRQRAHEIRHPVYIQMGGDDRVADNMAALKWIRETQSQDKRYEVYPICQHVIYKKAKTQHDDLAGRISVIADNVEWMIERSPAVFARRAGRVASYASDSSSISRSTSRTSLFDEDDDSASIATSVPTSPGLTERDIDVAEVKYAGGHRDEGHVLPDHLCGWRLDEEGEMRLYRRTWNFREDSRPFLHDPHTV
ncbi:lysophospholipase [Moesziomyces antarcticus]|uniref:Related to lysophospholipase n=2 Tax=Pseudozyma antarctica TaxID=84753 RepID=A0A5C3FNM3_PSEA2|nr:lysophospholipase [Moesziomyces antarcticus]GAK64492.1 lysophospholipase [Moesziomyces antarcticus]SPO44999.1 related to lysophospholipase [Moesziomyces antarcticus]